MEVFIPIQNNYYPFDKQLVVNSNVWYIDETMMTWLNKNINEYSIAMAVEYNAHHDMIVAGIIATFYNKEDANLFRTVWL